MPSKLDTQREPSLQAIDVIESVGSPLPFDERDETVGHRPTFGVQIDPLQPGPIRRQPEDAAGVIRCYVRDPEDGVVESFGSNGPYRSGARTQKWAPEQLVENHMPSWPRSRSM